MLKFRNFGRPPSWPRLPALFSQAVGQKSKFRPQSFVRLVVPIPKKCNTTPCPKTHGHKNGHTKTNHLSTIREYFFAYMWGGGGKLYKPCEISTSSPREGKYKNLSCFIIKSTNMWYQLTQELIIKQRTWLNVERSYI